MEKHPLRPEQIEDFTRCHDYINGQLAAYDRLVERGEPLSEIASEEIEDLLQLKEFYARQLGINDKSQDTHSAKKESE